MAPEDSATPAPAGEGTGTLTVADYNACVAEHADGLYRFIRHRLRHEEDARDVVQNAFEALWRQRRAVDPDPESPGVDIRLGNGLSNTRIEWRGNDEEDGKKDIVTTDWALLDVGVNTFVTGGSFGSAPAPFDDLRAGRSLSLDMHLFRQRLSLVKRKFNLEYGLTFAWSNYAFSNDIEVLPGQDVFAVQAAEDPLKKSKLSMTYLTVPLMLNVETNPDERKRSFRLSAGVTGGWRIASRTKTTTEEKRKVKQRDDFNLNDFRYGPSVRIGYGWFNLYGHYALSDFFADGEGPETHPVTIGLSLRPY
jgi:hypothetical protein